jgi:hypothetical protein
VSRLASQHTRLPPSLFFTQAAITTGTGAAASDNVPWQVCSHACFVLEYDHARNTPCRTVPQVGLLFGLVVFNTILLIKQFRGAWDSGR